jgi:hypothetical protein
MYVVPHHLPLLLPAKKKREMMGIHIRSVMNPVPKLEEEEGDDGEPHTFSNESSSFTGRRKGRRWGTTYIQ